MYIYYPLEGNPVSLWINRKRKVLHIACLKTNYSKIRINWDYLFDGGKEAEQDKETENLSDEDFKAKIDEAMITGVYERLNLRGGVNNPIKP